MHFHAVYFNSPFFSKLLDDISGDLSIKHYIVRGEYRELQFGKKISDKGALTNESKVRSSNHTYFLCVAGEHG